MLLNNDVTYFIALHIQIKLKVSHNNLINIRERSRSVLGPILEVIPLKFHKAPELLT
jgi:hypothetical protein